MTQDNSTQLISPSSFRIDKYLVNDIYGFNGQIDTDDRLIRNIIYSVAEDYEHSLFGFGCIDPARFAEKWQYDPSYLRKRVADPYQLRDMSPEEIAEYRERITVKKASPKEEPSDRYVWDTHLENAIYILSNKPFNFNNYGQFSVVDDKTKQEKVIKSHASFTLFTSISAVRRSRGKVVYSYTLNENFEKNLTRYYIRGEQNSLLQLRASGLDSLYLFLANLKTNLALKGRGDTSETEDRLDFDKLCRFAGIPEYTKDGKPYEPKKRKRLLIEALERISATTELSFSVTWQKGEGERAAYIPVVCYGTGHLQMFDTQRPGLGRMVVSEERKLIQRQLIQKEFLSIYKKVYSVGYLPVDEEKFNAWALDNDRDREEKMTALRLAYIGIFGCIPKNAAELSRKVFDIISCGKEATLSETLRSINLL